MARECRWGVGTMNDQPQLLRCRQAHRLASKRRVVLQQGKEGHQEGDRHGTYATERAANWAGTAGRRAGRPGSGLHGTYALMQLPSCNYAH